MRSSGKFGARDMNTRPEDITTEPAGAQLAVVRSTLGIVVRTLLVILAADALGSLALAQIGPPRGFLSEASEAVLAALIALPVLYATTLRPVTQLVRMQTHAAAEARFQVIAQAAGDAILILDAEWKPYFANQATEKMFGIRTREWKEASGEAFLPEDTKQFLQASRTRYRETGESALSKMGAFELDLLRSDGSQFPAEVRVSELKEGQKTHFVVVLRDISARKRAEEELRQSEQKYRMVVQNIDEIVYLVQVAGPNDLAGTVRLVSDHVENIIGYRPDEFLEDPGLWFRLLHPDDVTSVLQATQEIFATKQTGTRVYRVRHKKTGQYRWLEDKVVPQIDGGGNVVALFGVARDFTARKRAEEALRESEDRYRDLVEHSEDLICTHDLEGRILSVNEAPARILGYERSELLFKSIPNMLAPEVRQGFGEYMAKIRRDGVAKGLVIVQTRTGETRIWEYKNTLRTDAVAAPIVRGMAHDITERKQAEEALRFSEEKFSKAFHANPSAACLTTLNEGRILEVNERFEKMLEYRREELLGRTSLEIGLWGDVAERARVREDLRARNHVRNRALQFRTKSGKLRTFLYSAEILTVAGEQCLLAIGEDATERMQMEEALRQLSGRLLQVQDEERRRLARVLHDTAAQDLAGLAMNLNLVERSAGALDPTAREALSESISMAEQCSREVRTLSYLLHPPMLDELGLASAVRWYAEGFAQRSGIHVDVDVSPKLGRLPYEVELMLFRIVQESLTNIHRHSGSLTAKIGIVRNPTEIILEVKDQGRGLLQGALPEVSGSVEALGVGIAGMRERMRQLGGHLDIDSGSQGTTVRAIQQIIGIDS
jgi:PAS domain S-box-containing protein